LRDGSASRAQARHWLHRRPLRAVPPSAALAKQVGGPLVRSARAMMRLCLWIFWMRRRNR